jgi:hypothetical protein
MAAKNPVRPTAAHVRAALGLPSNQRGQLSEADIARYNKGKRADRRYVRGQSRALVSEAKAAAKAQREALRAAGVAVGERGPLPKAALAQTKG